jgi:glutaminyl-peptide cyclotransferase
MRSPRLPGSWELLCAPILVCLLTGTASSARAAAVPTFNGGHAFEDLQRIVAFGPRPSGSPALVETRRWIIKQLELSGLPVEEDKFVAATPAGNIPMSNLIVKLPGERPQVILVAGHYETKRFAQFRFVGANDGGSSAALLMELARVLKQRRNGLTMWLVFFDGEEAMGEWSQTDGIYGSRHLAEELSASGELGRIRAMILVDMIADAHLNVQRDLNSTPWLSDLLFDTARRLGYARFFPGKSGGYEDDHLPFVNAGVPAVDLIDFDYGPGNGYWHTPADTVDKCSPTSLTIVGRVVAAVLDELDKSPHLH